MEQPAASRKAAWRGQSRASQPKRRYNYHAVKTVVNTDGSLHEAKSCTGAGGASFETVENTSGVLQKQDWPELKGEVAAVRFLDAFGASEETGKSEQEEETNTEAVVKDVYPRERKVYAMDCVQPTVDDRSWWERAKDKMALFSALWCCGLESDVRDIQANDEVKARVSAEMVTSIGLHSYMRGKDIVSRDAIQQVMDSHDLSQDSSGTHRVVVVPAFISSCVVALRMKLGEGATDRKVPGNVELVKAETARLLREYNVRLTDAALHQKFIIKAFFDDDTHYRVTDSRARLASKSRLIKWLLSQDEKPHYDC